MQNMTGGLLYGLGMTLLAALTPHAAAQTFPNKSIRIIVAQGAGSATDTAARVIGQKLAGVVGQQVIVDNRPGAGGLLGTELAAKAPADGYTLIFANISTHGVNPALYKKLPYDPVKDFAPISMASTTPNVLAVHPSIPSKSTKEFIAFVKSRPGQLNAATPGNGSSQHLATELFKMMAGGLDTVHVPYKGSGPAITALMTGESSWMIPTLTLALPHIKSQKVRALAVTALKPVDDLPGVPVVVDTLPGYEVLSWYGFAAPAGTPPAIVNRLNEATAKVLAMTDTKKSLAAVGMSAQASTPEQFGAFIRAELAKWSKVAKAANIHLD
jgi:tripartite-type tricarboxylate transporter receptor subunit TctC